MFPDYFSVSYDYDFGIDPQTVDIHIKFSNILLKLTYLRVPELFLLFGVTKFVDLFNADCFWSALVLFVGGINDFIAEKKVIFIYTHRTQGSSPHFASNTKWNHQKIYSFLKILGGIKVN